MEPTEPAPQDARFASRRLLVRVALALLALALLWTATAWIVPGIVRTQAQRAATEQLGRRLSLGRISFNPWTLELTIADIAIAGATEAAPPQLAIQRLHVDLAFTSVLHRAPVVDALDIDAPMVRLTRTAEGHYDVDDVLAHLAARPASPDVEPARFAVHNIVVRDGGADFTDMPVQAVHRVRQLELAIPFLSSLPAEREVKVEPHLAFALDGSRFDSAASATPFADSGRGEAHLKLERFDVLPYLGYLPKSLPVRLQTATLSVELRVAFERRPRQSLNVSGTVEMAAIKVADVASAEMLQAGSVKVAIDSLRPLEGLVRLHRIDVDAPHVLAVRNAAGRVNLLLAAEEPSGETVALARVPLPTTAASAAASAAALAASGAASGAAGGAPRWSLSLAELSIRAGQLDWRDATTVPAAALALTDFSLDAKAIAWPLDAPVVFQGAGVLAAATDRGKFAFSGQGNAAGAAVKLGIDALPLALARPYLRGLLVPPLAGDLSADLAIEWEPSASAPQIKVEAKRLALAGLALGEAKAPEVAAELIELTDARIDTAGRTASIGRLALTAPRLRADRDRDGRWGFERWLRQAAPAGTAPAWKIAIGEIALEKGRVNFSDLSHATPVAVDVSQIGVQLRGWAGDSTAAAPPAPFRVVARVGVPAGRTGKAVGSGVVGSVDVRGEMKAFAAGVPGRARATIALKDLPLHLLDPYIDNRYRIEVQKAQTSFRGDFAWEQKAAGASLRLRGDATIDDFRAANEAGAAASAPGPAASASAVAAGRQLLDWKSLSLRGIDLALAPGAPTRLRVAETALSDFFARVVLDETGRLNLKDVAGAAPAGPAAAASGAAGERTVAASAPASAAAGSAATAGPAAILDFGPIAVVNGRLVYNDRFIKPNYTANISELTGKLGAFSSRPPAPGEAPQLADLSLTGRVEGTATLEISGKVNPLAKPLALDLQAKVRDLELPALSPYAIKYSGYGIERGKMSVDLAYLVKPDGQLTASNRIVLNQLAFGDKVEGSTASLPVKLAVALLADRNGVIDLDLPVGGSINDPQFSIGGIVWKLVTNLVVKAVTAPFSLLASAFGGGGSELSSVEFPPGAASLTPAAKAGLDKVAKALAERPALNLTVNGESRLEAERDAWKHERLQQLVRFEKRRQAIAGGAAANAEVTVADAEYPALLKEVYRRTDIVKPKNVLGFAKDLPTQEMEALLLTSLTVPDDAMQQLAVRRAVAVRDYLASKNLPTARLFLGAPKTAPDEAAWKPHADLRLAIE